MIELEKHLPGKHDQKTHGRRRGGRLLADLKSRGGFTYQPITGHTPTEGYAVSIYPECEAVIPAEELDREAIDAYLEKHIQAFRANPSAYAGGWYDSETGKVYLDISVVVSDAKIAEELCTKHGQEGYFDFRTGKTVIVKPPEERRKSAEGCHDAFTVLCGNGEDDTRGAYESGGGNVRSFNGQTRGIGPPVSNADISKISGSPANRPAAFVLGGGGDMPNRLTQIEVEEVSGVDRAANRKRFLLMKRERGEEMNKVDKPMKTEDKMPAKQGFLTRIAEGLRGVFKAGGETFAENMVQEQVNQKFWMAFDALRSAVDSTLRDEALTPAEKTEQVAVSLGQFQEFILGLVAGGVGKSEDGAMQKVGAKIARHRLEKLKAAHAVLSEILAEVEPDGEGDEMTKDEIAKAVEEAVAGKLAEVSKRVDPLAELPGKVEDLLKRHGELLGRVEALEAAKGLRKSVPGQDEPGEVKKSKWAGIL